MKGTPTITARWAQLCGVCVSKTWHYKNNKGAVICNQCKTLKQPERKR